MNIEPIDPSRLAKTGQEYLDLVLSDAEWLARTADDVKQLRYAGAGAFAKLPEEDFQAFLADLKFHAGGVMTGTYRPLMASLTLTDIFEVFARFGMSQEYFLRTHESKCVPPCSFEFWAFCTSTCDHVVKPEN